MWHDIHGGRRVPLGIDERVGRRHHVPWGRWHVPRVPRRWLDKGIAGAGRHAERLRAGAARVALLEALGVGQRDHRYGARVEHGAHHRVEGLARACEQT